jgi:DNA-binding IclR family transcriptional regulator
MAAKRVAGKTREHIIKILKVLRKAYREGETLSVNRIAKETGLHKWSVSRILDLYMPYVSVKTIPELEQLGLSAKLVELANPKITDKQALLLLEARA